MGKIIGIDLGTTNSCVAIIEVPHAGAAPHIKVIPNAEGARTTPSILGVAGRGRRRARPVAKRQALTNPQDTVFAVKRLMGRKFDSPDVKKQIELAPYRIVASPNGDAWVHVQGRDISPPEISAIVLAKMKEIAEAFLGQTVT